MKYVRYGKTSIKMSPICLGTWKMGGNEWGKVDNNQSIIAIHSALYNGINIIDTAPCYGFGHSEEVVGKALDGRRSSVILSTKCGVVWNGNGSPLYEVSGKKMYINLNPNSIKAEVEMSLKRLKTHYIDIYHVHWPDNLANELEVLECLSDLKKRGKIRYFAISNCYRNEYMQYIDMYNISGIQVKYNIFDRRVEKNLFQICDEKKLGVLAYSPLEQGVFTKLKESLVIDKEDIRYRNKWFNENKQQILEWVYNRMSPFMEKYRCTLEQLLLIWGLTQKNVSGVICGSINPSHIQENILATDIKLDERDRDLISKLTNIKNIIREMYI